MPEYTVMSEQNRKNGEIEDAYDLLLKRFEVSSPIESDSQEDDVKNSGEIYFSANADTPHRQSSSRPERVTSSYERSSRTPTSRRATPSETPPMRSSAHGTQERRSSAFGTSEQRGMSHRTTAPRTSSPRPSASSHPSSRPNGTERPFRQETGRNEVRPRTSSDSLSGQPQRRPVSSAARAKRKKKKQQSTIAVTVGIIAVVALLAVIVRIPIMWCVNDILAINADSTHKRVVITDNMDVDDVINLLGKKKLVNSTGFCKIAAKFLKYDKKSDKTKRVYPAGEYDLSASMGLEGMLNEILSAGSVDSTVTLTFPEGYTVSQIAAKLSSNGVCSTAEFYAALNDEDFLKNYEFLSGIKDKNLRYKLLEGYMYPDTYEFYIDETPRSVVKRFLDNFESKWDDMFAEKAKKSNYSIDEILTVASIVEREAKNGEQMPVIASVIYNRLSSSSFPYINCDSTGKYISAYQEELAAKGVYANYLKVYDTYQKTGLPVGPICNPGKQAINAALAPDTTSYYYFLHDKTGKLYLASTQSEHDRNKSAAGIN